MKKFLQPLALATFAAAAWPASAMAEEEWNDGLHVDLVSMYSQSETDYPLSPGTPDQTGMDGGYMGVGVGYDVAAGNFVFGGGADITFGDGSTYVDDGNAIDEWGEVSQFLEVYLRAGYLVNDNTLVYVIGGVSQADLTQGESCPDGFQFGFCGVNRNPRTSPFHLEETQTIDGTMFGAGVELSLSDDWTVRLEYRQRDYDEVTYVLSPDASGNPLPPSIVDLDSRAVGVVLSYRR